MCRVWPAWHYEGCARSEQICNRYLCALRFGELQLDRYSDCGHRRARARAARTARKIRRPRHARGHHGKLNVRLHCGDSFVSAKKISKTKTAKTVLPGTIAGNTSTSRSPDGEFERAGKAADFILSQTSLRPRIALVLGSGLGAFADEFGGATKIPYAKIPHFPQSTAIGHAGKLVIGKVGAIPVAGVQGRVHLYEGYSAKEVAFPIRVFARMGVKAVILTNAAGGIKRELSQGGLVGISDQINLQGVNPLTGPHDERFGLRLHDL